MLTAHLLFLPLHHALWNNLPHDALLSDSLVSPLFLYPKQVEY